MTTPKMASIAAAFAAVSIACSQTPSDAGSGVSGGQDAINGTGGTSSAGGSGGAMSPATGGRSGGNAASGGSGGATTGSGGATATDAGGGDAASSKDAGTSDGGAGALVCGSANEDAAITLSCPSGQIVDQVVFASYGNPSGDCASFAAGSCSAATSVSVVEGLCAGRASCVVPASNGAFGDPCNGMTKHAAVAVKCVNGTPVQPSKPFKGVANSPCAARTALDVSWYYNWEQTETEPCTDGRGGEFVPMIWGHTGAEQTGSSITSAVTSFASKGYGYVLGFNEPDNSGQANIPANTAIMLWPSFDNPAIKLVTPATTSNSNGQAWFSDFMMQVNGASGSRADVIALHWYGWNSGSCDANASGLENYIKWAEAFPGGRPIWITEWGCLNQSAPDENTVTKFYQGALAVFARHPRVERYSWYPWATNCGLSDNSGTLTALGKIYAAAPAYR